MKRMDLPKLKLDQAGALEKLVQTLDTLPDPRTQRKPLHALTTVVAMALCAVVADCDSWLDIANFAVERKAWFATFLDLTHGVPSRDTFRRVFARLKPQAFQRLILQFVAALREPEPSDDQHLALDGKTLRGSFDRAAEQSPLHLVQAFCTSTHLVLAQAPTTIGAGGEHKQGNEITAIPQVLDLLDLQGAIITSDAIGCQTKIAEIIIAGGGDYLLALKDNHPTLHAQAQDYFEELHGQEQLPAGVHACETADRPARSRREQRYYTAAPLPAGLYKHHEWRGLKSLLQTTTVIEHRDGRTTTDTRYYLSSLPAADINRLARCVRRHWAIESAHWVLDVTFGEDASRIRKGQAAENFATLRRISYALLRTYQKKPRPDQKKTQPSLKGLRKQAGWSTTLLAKVITQRT